MSPDGRTTLARPDLAAAWLEGLVPAQRYAPMRARRCRVTSAPIREAPSAEAVQQDQLLFGERFEVLETRDGWAWGQAARDGYVGYVRAEALDGELAAPTHRVSAIRTLGFERPDKKAPVMLPLSINSLVTAEREAGGWVETSGAGWVFAGHLAPVGGFERDPAAVAERFLGAPYLWGGREITGVDCSGLVQQALLACGRGCPRDADQQAAALGREIGESELRRGDLVFWPGHVAMMLDEARAVHATGSTMSVVVEPVEAITSRRLAAGSGGPTVFRRPLC
ncbi:MAG TPA: C40 family peptidase [Caulobacteraceae bacterium]|jgi:cell wall-associated NlpC family hydrolase